MSGIIMISSMSSSSGLLQHSSHPPDPCLTPWLESGWTSHRTDLENSGKTFFVFCPVPPPEMEKSEVGYQEILYIFLSVFSHIFWTRYCKDYYQPCDWSSQKIPSSQLAKGCRPQKLCNDMWSQTLVRISLLFKPLLRPGMWANECRDLAAVQMYSSLIAV